MQPNVQRANSTLTNLCCEFAPHRYKRVLSLKHACEKHVIRSSVFDVIFDCLGSIGDGMTQECNWIREVKKQSHKLEASSDKLCTTKRLTHDENCTHMTVFFVQLALFQQRARCYVHDSCLFDYFSNLSTVTPTVSHTSDERDHSGTKIPCVVFLHTLTSVDLQRVRTANEGA